MKQDVSVGVMSPKVAKLGIVAPAGPQGEAAAALLQETAATIRGRKPKITALASGKATDVKKHLAEKGSHVLFLCHAPRAFVCGKMAGGTLPSRAVAQWVKATKQTLSLVRRFRAQATLVTYEDMRRAPEISVRSLHKRFAWTAPKTVPAMDPGPLWPLVQQVIAEQSLSLSPDARAVIGALGEPLLLKKAQIENPIDIDAAWLAVATNVAQEKKDGPGFYESENEILRRQIALLTQELETQIKSGLEQKETLKSLIDAGVRREMAFGSEINAKQSEIEALLRSTSWRVTAPLRWGKSVLAQLR